MKIKALVLSILGLDELPIKEGKVDFSVLQKNTLKTEFAKMGPDFLTDLESALNAELENKPAAEINEAVNKLFVTMKMATDKEIKELGEKITAFNSENEKLKEKVAKLADASEEDIKAEIDGKIVGKIVPFKPDMKMAHNIMAKGYTEGTMDLSVAASTMDVSELASEFGSYMSQFGISLEIIKKLTQATETEKFMTTKLAITEWKASKALISSVVQQFSAKWTPLGQAKFTPIVIKNRRHKINVPLTPDEIMDGWLAYLYDENLSPEQMPVTKYIVEQLILPKVDEDRELRLIGKGVYEELGGYVAENDPGQATGKSMDGFITILKKEKASGTSAISFADLETLTDENIVDQMNKFVDGIDELYQDKPMPIFCSNKLYKMYKRAYQKIYPVTKNNDETDDNIDFSPQRLQKLPSMAGEMVFFCTPKENFIRLQHKNSGASKIFMEKRRYDVEVMAEWWEAPGFAIGEAVFAYVPDEDSESGS